MRGGRRSLDLAWRWFALVVSVLLAAGCGGGGGGTGDSGVPPATFAGAVFYQIAAGDLDDDGRTDLAAIAVVQDGKPGTTDPIEVQVLLQDPAVPGHFAVSQRLTMTTPLGAIAVADLDGDGRDDIAVTEPAGDRVRVFLQDSAVAGRFALKETRAAGAGLGSIEVADVDLDGAPDLVVAFGGGVQVLRQDLSAPGTFPLLTVVDGALDGSLALPAEHDSLAVGDLDENALVDLATVRADPEARLYRHEPAVPGTFAPAEGLSLDLKVPYAVAVADVDGDRLNDVVAVGSDGQIFPEVILRIRRQDPVAPGTFLPVAKWTLDENGEPRQVVIADVTDDGLPDVLVPKLFVVDHGYVEVLGQTGPAFGFRRLGIYVPLKLAGVDPYLRGFAVADLNADGFLDMAVTDGELSGFFNDPAAPGSFAAAERLLD